MSDDVRRQILARRARFVAAAMAAFVPGACAATSELPRATSGAAATPSGASSSAIRTSAANGTSDASVSGRPSAAARATTAASATPADLDHDGIPDADDACPTLAGPRAVAPSKNGCPQVVAQVCLSIIIIERPYFDAGKTSVRPESVAVLDATADTLKAHPEFEIEVSGHCDSTERPPLDEKRATVVRDALAARGIDPARLHAKGYGSTRPIAPNETLEGRAKNRRVDFQIVSPPSP